MYVFIRVLIFLMCYRLPMHNTKYIKNHKPFAGHCCICGRILVKPRNYKFKKLPTTVYSYYLFHNIEY